MKRTNRVEPIHTNARELTRAIMITTTQLEIVQRVEVSPINESVTDRVRFRPDQPCVTTKRSRKILWCICCLFITAGILALSIVITGFTIVFKKMNAMKKSNIERYDLGDLYYGINNINHPSNTYLSNMNKIFIQKYLSDQLLTEPGYRGLVIDEIFVQDKLDNNKRNQRDTSSCSIIFIIQNIQVYFDYCSTCTKQRNLILSRLFFNITAFRKPFYLLLNNLHIFVQICSTPNISHLITPVRLNTNLPSIPSNTLFSLKTNSTIDTSKSNDISTVVSTIYDTKSMIDLIETTSINNLEESISFTTDHLSTITNFDSSQTQETSSMSWIDTESSTYISTSTKLTTSHTKTSFQKTTRNIFQFLPFRPLMTQRYNNNSLTVIKTNTNQQRTSTQRQTSLKHEKIRTF